MIDFIFGFEDSDLHSESNQMIIKLLVIMKVIKKFLKFQDIQLNTLHQHPKDISRAHLKLIDTTNNNQFYKTFTYGNVQPTKVHWTSPIQLPFEGQQSLHFETVCQHEFGYQIQELKALYNGIIYLKPDQFFFYNTTHCLNQQGEQCGTLKFMIKIVQREEGNKKIQAKEAPPRQPVKINLVAKISIYGANLVVNPYYLNNFHKKKKRNLKLEIHYQEMFFVGQPRFGQLEYKWQINSKFEVNDNSSNQIHLKILEDDHQYLDAIIQMQKLEENKRFTVQIVQMVDKNSQKIAALHLDLRYISKKEILDLMYSPKQLSQNKIQRKEEQESQGYKFRTSSVKGEIRMQKEKKLYDILHNRSMSKQLSNYSKPKSPNRYHINILNGSHQVSIPRSKRFNQAIAINSRVSYVEPDFLSDFSPLRKVKKGATQSSSHKVDFTKQHKFVPGVGEYHLPSIWQKK